MALTIIAGLVCFFAVVAIFLMRVARARRKVRKHKLNLLEDLSAPWRKPKP